MGKDTDFTPFDAGVVNPLLNYKKIGGEGPVSVWQDNSVELSDEQVARLSNAGATALKIAGEIVGHDPLQNFNISELPLRITADEADGLMGTNFVCDASLLNYSPDTVSGAILHELVEGEREAKGISGMDEVPLLTEFMFCAEDREGLFDEFNQHMFDETSSKLPHYALAWTRIATDVANRGVEDINLDPEWIWDRMKELKSGLTNDEKVGLVQEYLYKDFT